MKKPLAYILRGHDINAYYFSGSPNGTVCPRCGSWLNRSYLPATLDVQEAPRYEFGYTHDLQPLFSKSLINIINAQNETFLAGSEIPGSGGYYYLSITDTIEFDAKRRKTKFGPRCDLCSQHEWIAGAIPAFFIGDQVSPKGISKTDLEFGDRHGKSPLLVVGTQLKEKIESYRFPGIYFDEAYCSGERRLKSPEDELH